LRGQRNVMSKIATPMVPRWRGATMLREAIEEEKEHWEEEWELHRGVTTMSNNVKKRKNTRKKNTLTKQQIKQLTKKNDEKHTMKKKCFI
jgi:hypothetical protein